MVGICRFNLDRGGGNCDPSHATYAMLVIIIVTTRVCFVGIKKGVIGRRLPPSFSSGRCAFFNGQQLLLVTLVVVLMVVAITLRPK